jgi:hypothetical protein
MTCIELAKNESDPEAVILPYDHRTPAPVVSTLIY